MLGGHNHGSGTYRPAVDVAETHLALGVGPERRLGSGMAGLGERFEDGVRVVDRRRHQYVGFATGVAEHNALIACALVLIAA